MSERTKSQAKALADGAGWSGDFISKLVKEVDARGGEPEDILFLTKDRGRPMLESIADYISGWHIEATIRVEVTPTPKVLLTELYEEFDGVDDGAKIILEESQQDSSYVVDVLLLRCDHPAMDRRMFWRLLESHHAREATAFEMIEAVKSWRPSSPLPARVSTEDACCFGDIIDGRRIFFTQAEADRRSPEDPLLEQYIEIELRQEGRSLQTNDHLGFFDPSMLRAVVIKDSEMRLRTL